MRDRWLQVSVCIYRVLLGMYPKEFREAYGPQMVQVFGDLCRSEWERGGMVGLAKLWAYALVDLAAAAIAEGKDNGEMAMNGYRAAAVGFVLLLAPLLFVAASLLNYGLGIGFLFDPLEALLADPQRRSLFNLVSPVVFLGGLVLALVVNAWTILRLDFGREDGALVGTVRVEVRLLNIAVAGLSLILLGTLVGYVFLENFDYRY